MCVLSPVVCTSLYFHNDKRATEVESEVGPIVMKNVFAASVSIG